MFDERPLPPIEGRRRTVMKVVIAGYVAVAAAWFVAAAFEGGVVRIVFGVLVSVLAAGQIWDFRRRTRPEHPVRRRRGQGGSGAGDVTRRAAPGRGAGRRDRSR